MAAGPSDADDAGHYTMGLKTRMAGFFEHLPPGFVRSRRVNAQRVILMETSLLSGPNESNQLFVRRKN